MVVFITIMVFIFVKIKDDTNLNSPKYIHFYALSCILDKIEKA